MNDEVLVTNQTVIIDNGSGIIKGGFAGHTKPSVLLPAYVGRPKNPRCMTHAPQDEYFVGSSALKYRGLLRLNYPNQHGVINNWEDMERLWVRLFEEMKTEAKEHPVLLTEAPLNPRSNRERCMEVFFENFNVPGLFISIQAVLSLYASGRTGGVVLDVGDGVSHVVPVVEGFALMHSVKRADLAGRDVTEWLASSLRYCGQIFHTSAEMEIVRAIKETACYVATAPFRDDLGREVGGLIKDIDKNKTGRPSSENREQSQTSYTYTLPDGSPLIIGPERYRAPEILFNPSIVGFEYPGVHQLVANSISRTDLDLRKELTSQIILSGGSTLFPGFVDRLLMELKKVIPKDSIIRLYAPPERQLATYVGGAILGSLSTFKQLVITKKLYQEEGSSLIARKAV